MPAPPTDEERRDAAPGHFVVIGGGTGISPCLRGLREAGQRVTAIVTVADDGGSSGRLRKEYDILPPGDIRNSLVALSTAGPLREALFSYRFEDSLLRGHSLGNLLLAVLTRLTGDFRKSIDEARSILGIKDTVLPSTDTRVVLVAHHPDGTKSTGEQVISRCGKPISAMELRPRPPRVSEEIEAAVQAADLIVLGPGSLYTSIIPNLLVPGMTAVLEASPAPVVLVGNLMTQPGETDGFDLGDHVRILREVGGLRRLDLVIECSERYSEDVIARYQEAGAAPVQAAAGASSVEGVAIKREAVSCLTPEGLVRHDGGRLADVLLRLIHGEGCR